MTIDLQLKKMARARLGIYLQRSTRGVTVCSKDDDSTPLLHVGDVILCVNELRSHDARRVAAHIVAADFVDLLVLRSEYEAPLLS